MQNIIFGLANGSIYALMALAIGIVNLTTRTMNFAHASVIMLGAMTSLWAMTFFNFSYWSALLLAIVINMIVNILMYKLCIEKLGDLFTNNGWIITTFGTSIIIDNFCRMKFGSQTYAYPYLFNDSTINILGSNIMLHEIMMIAIPVIIGLIYQNIIKKTRFGCAVRAVSFKPKTSKLMGINSEFIILICFGIAGAVAAIAGTLIAPITFASFNMTATVGIKGYTAALIGGLGNTTGAFLGGFLLGLIEMFIVTVLPVPIGIRDAITFSIMILFILFLPGGIVNAKIFGRSEVSTEKV